MFDNKSTSKIESAATNSSDSNESGASFLVRILKYLETPQYLRKSLFPKQNDLRYVVCTGFLKSFLFKFLTFVFNLSFLGYYNQVLFVSSDL